MQHQRRTGLWLLLASALVFAGSANDVIPPATFFLGTALAGLGTLLFVRGERVAEREIETRVSRNIRPELANREAMRTTRAQAAAAPAPPPADEVALCARDAIDFDDTSEDLEVATDVSFPVEVQEERRVAEQLEKLRRLAADGVISADEFEAAKARILS